MRVTAVGLMSQGGARACEGVSRTELYGASIRARAADRPTCISYVHTRRQAEVARNFHEDAHPEANGILFEP
jgi:hypothetical protein